MQDLMKKNAHAGWAVPTDKIRRWAQPTLHRYNYLCLGCLLFAAATGSAEAKLNVFASILPQAYFAERVGGDFVAVNVLVGPGQSPHAYEPTPKQIMALSQADVFFKIGLPFEDRLLGKISSILKNAAVVDTRKGIALRPSEDNDAHAGEHAGPDPHIWLAPKLILQQAQTICEALCQRDAAHCAVYRRNLAAFQTGLEALDAELSRRLAPFAGREIVVFHPALGYFTDAYKLKQVPIEMAGKEPGSKSFAELVSRARTAGVKTIFAERQFSPKSAEAVAQQIGAEVVMIDPLARDCFQNLREIAEKIEKIK
jgi:zinc transport system substrate-binding protein